MKRIVGYEIAHVPLWIRLETPQMCWFEELKWFISAIQMTFLILFIYVCVKNKIE